MAGENGYLSSKILNNIVILVPLRTCIIINHHEKIRYSEYIGMLCFFQG